MIARGRANEGAGSGLGKGGAALAMWQPKWMTVHPVPCVSGQLWQRMKRRAHMRAHAGRLVTRVERSSTEGRPQVPPRPIAPMDRPTDRHGWH